MRRKRLKHVAFTLCEMFCGWRLINSYNAIAELGSGVLSINVPTAKCDFNGKEIKSIHIAGELQFWFQKELADNNIPAEAVISAEVVAELEVKFIESKKRTKASYFFSSDGKHIKSVKIYQCKIDCYSKIITNEAEYRGRSTGVEEWPEDF